MKARDIMTTTVVTVTPDTSIAAVAALFEKRRIRRAPVLRGRRLVGIVTRADLVRGLALPAREARLARWQSDDGIRTQLLEELGAQAWWRTGASVMVNGGLVHFLGIYDSEEAKRASRVAAENISRMTAIRTGGRALGILGAAVILAACGELPQDGPKPFVKDATYSNESAAHAPGLAERARFQDEYALLEDKPQMTLAEGTAK